MSDRHQLSFSDLMAILPPLHPRELARQKVTTLRQLRLVSKEVGSLALTAVTSCTVHLGAGQDTPVPEQLVRLLAGAELHSLSVTLTVTSGPTAPTVAEQLRMCISQMYCLVSGMAKAIKTTKELKLTVVHQHSTPALLSVPQQLQGIPCQGDSNNAVTSAAASAPGAVSPAVAASATSAAAVAAATAAAATAAAAEAAGTESPSDSDNADADPTSSDEEELESESEEEEIEQEPVQPPVPLARTTCPPRLRVISGSVFAILAEAVPGLQELSLQGCMWDAALDTFGACCPRLDTLYIQALSVQINALRSITSHFPNLQTVEFVNKDVTVADEEQLGDYMDDALMELMDCHRLADLVIEFSEGITLRCLPATWDFLPCSLYMLQCNCLIESSAPYETVIRHLYSLDLVKPPASELLEILQTFPNLKDLTITLADGPFVLDCAKDTEGLLRKRILEDGFTLTCHGMTLIGTGCEVKKALACLRPMRFVEMIFLRISGDLQEQGDCLELLHHVFPEAIFLQLSGDSDALQEAITDGGMLFLKSLVACSQLSTLLLLADLDMTTADLLTLCTSLPHLETLRYRSCEGVDSELLAEGLEAIDRVLDVDCCV